MTSARLPFQPLETSAAPEVIDREGWLAAVAELTLREKAHTREGDAIAAARRRLPMTPVRADAPLVGVDGPTTLLGAFEGRRQLLVYFHMWHDGQPFEGQCEGCTLSAQSTARPEFLNSRDVTVAIFTEGTIEESAPYAAFLQTRLPWYSSREAPELVDGRGYGLLAAYLRVGDEVYETWWCTGRGTEVIGSQYGLLDRTVFGRQENWEDSPTDWPRGLGVRGEQMRASGRPIFQWAVTDAPAAEGADEHRAAT